MTNVGDIVGSVGGAISSLTLSRITPEPRSRYGLNFGNLLSRVASEVSQNLPGFGGGMNPIYIDLINRQIEVQQQMQLVSFQSNIEKSRHETEMAAIRNIRVG